MLLPSPVILKLPLSDSPAQATLYYGIDVIEGLKGLQSESVHMIATSPPYWGLRDYKIVGQFGQEPSPTEYVLKLVEILEEAKRVLRADGVLYLNLGDSFVGSNGMSVGKSQLVRGKEGRPEVRENVKSSWKGLPPKNLIGIPWKVAFALQDAGWWLRSEIIWHKMNPMPDPAKDRPTRAHEHIFLLTKSPNYYYDSVAIRTTHNIHSVWQVPPAPYREAHFATWPPALCELMIKSGSGEHGCCPVCFTPLVRPTIENGYPNWEASCLCFSPDPPVPCTVMDIFSGSGSTGLAALQLGRNYIGIDLQADYLDLAKGRILGVETSISLPPGEEPVSETYLVEDLNFSL